MCRVNAKREKIVYTRKEINKNTRNGYANDLFFLLHDLP